MSIFVTCRTENCGNAGHTIELQHAAELVVCGVCELEITDKISKDE